MLPKAENSLQEWLSWLERAHPVAIELGLDRVLEVAKRLQVLNWSIPIITLAGTNGKGSTAAALTSILCAQKLQVGTYTSPHIQHFCERIRLDNKMIAEDKLIEAFVKVAQALDQTSLSYFEFTTLAALWLFKQAKLDVLILEVGMGGRLDAVNIINPSIAVITSIALDHTEYLGNSREQIAYEKLGIVREQGLLVCTETNLPTNFKTIVHEKKATAYYLNQDFYFAKEGPVWHWRNQQTEMHNLKCPDFPLASAAAALQVCWLLKAYFTIDQSAIYQGLAQAFLAGRYQTLRQQPKFIVDVAHNPHSAQYLAQKIVLEKKTRLILIFSALQDKDVRSMINYFSSLADSWHIAPLNCSRSLSKLQLAEIFSILPQEKIHLHNSLDQACFAALNEARSEDCLLAWGSFYTVAESMHFIENSIQ